MKKYHTALICKNGHCISAYFFPQDGPEKYCETCGAENISKCLECDTPIRGKINDVNSVIWTIEKYKVPSYCYNCGSPYPWTKGFLDQTNDLIQLEDSLSSDEKKMLLNASQRIMVESNTSAIDASIFKKLASKSGKFLKDALYQFAVDVASETAKKVIFPDS